jgi:hypothetical protein
MLRRVYFINTPFTLPIIDIRTDHGSVSLKITTATHYSIIVKYGKKGGPSSKQVCRNQKLSSVKGGTHLNKIRNKTFIKVLHISNIMV